MQQTRSVHGKVAPVRNGNCGWEVATADAAVKFHGKPPRTERWEGVADILYGKGQIGKRRGRHACAAARENHRGTHVINS